MIKTERRDEYESIIKVYKKIRKGYQTRLIMVKEENGEIITDESKVIERWRTYFEELLNRPEPDNPVEPIILFGPELEIKAPTMYDVISAIKRLRNIKSPGIDKIPAEIWKYGGDVLEGKLYDLITIIWR